MNRPNRRQLAGRLGTGRSPCRSIPDRDVAFGEFDRRSFLDAPRQSQAMLDASRLSLSLIIGSRAGLSISLETWTDCPRPEG